MILEIEISFYSHRLINFWRSTLTVLSVVYLLIPTSNHNVIIPVPFLLGLYIFWFLHQTTTCHLNGEHSPSCISFDSYIKPQLVIGIYRCTPVVYLLIPTSNHNKSLDDRGFWWVVYLLIPTSNHNYLAHRDDTVWLYIFWFLHQTTT